MLIYIYIYEIYQGNDNVLVRQKMYLFERDSWIMDLDDVALEKSRFFNQMFYHDLPGTNDFQ